MDVECEFESGTLSWTGVVLRVRDNDSCRGNCPDLSLPRSGRLSLTADVTPGSSGFQGAVTRSQMDVRGPTLIRAAYPADSRPDD
jgi:hypothetical protein